MKKTFFCISVIMLFYFQIQAQKVEQIILSHTSLVMDIFETTTITHSVLPENAANKTVTWASSNVAVVSVRNGVLIAMSGGTAIIECSATDSSGVKASVSVIVTQNIRVTSIVLPESNSNLMIGQSKQLVATVLPTDATIQSVTWSSSNPEIATVSANGVVTALQPGSATISATSMDDGLISATTVIECYCKSIDANAPTLIVNESAYSPTLEDFAHGYKQLNFEVQNIPNSTFLWAYKNNILDNGQTSVSLQLQFNNPFPSVSVWRRDENNCISDTTTVTIQRQYCLPQPTLQQNNYITLFPDEEFPILSVLEHNAVWYDKNLNIIEQGAILDLNTKNIDRSIETYKFYVLQQENTCTGMARSITIKKNRYIVRGTIQNYSNILSDDFIVKVNDGLAFVSIDTKGTFTYYPQAAGTYTFELVGNKNVILHSDSIQTLTISTTDFNKTIEFTCEHSVTQTMVMETFIIEQTVVGRPFSYIMKFTNIQETLYNVEFDVYYQADTIKIINNVNNCEFEQKSDNMVTILIDSIPAGKSISYSLAFQVLPNWELTNKHIKISSHYNSMPLLTKSRILNSYDPNDKQVIPSYGDEGYVLMDEQLEYKIRFQNTGTADAWDIYIVDTLDSNLDISTLRIKDASHDMTWECIHGIIRFDFANIMLPDSTTNEPGSHGYVIYTISPKSELPEETKVKNTAYIFFDYNPPVITNTTQSVYVTELPKSEEVPNQITTLDFDYTILPNPAKDFIIVKNAHNQDLRLVTILGEELMSFSLYNETPINIGNLVSGIYFIQINNSHIVSFIKQ